MSDKLLQNKHWKEAERRAKVLAALPEQLGPGDVADAMEALGVSRATVFRLLRRYREDQRTSSMLPRPKGPKPVMQPLQSEIETIVRHHFTRLYATRRKPTRARFWREVAADCRAEGFPAPSIRRLGRWLKEQDQADLMRRREGKGKSEPVFLATPGGLAAATPLEIVQIDHTRVDVTVVDPVTRLAVGRPTLTVAIDVNTRMVLGFYLSLEPPSLTAVALCLTHAVMDKSAWLAARGMANAWPAQGIPKLIHVDNGAEFHAHAFERACSEYGIELAYRPPGTPRFGGHIERLIGTMMGAVHLLPGSHFSNTRERGDLDSEAEAVMTLRELEVYMALEITGAYHARVHKALDLPPQAVWNVAFTDAEPRLPQDPRQFLIDFLPGEERVLQRDGLHLFHIRYWSNELRWLMGRSARKATIKYDPRDLLLVFVKTEDGIIEARPADLTRPSITLWEHRSARRALREAGRKAVDEELIFSTILAQRALVDEAQRTTKAIRRERNRRSHLRSQKLIDITPELADQEPGSKDQGETGKPLTLPYYEVEEWDDD